MFSRDFTDPVNHLTQNETLIFSDQFSRQNECMQKYCSADFELVVRFETL